MILIKYTFKNVDKCYPQIFLEKALIAENISIILTQSSSFLVSVGNKYAGGIDTI